MPSIEADDDDVVEAKTTISVLDVEAKVADPKSGSANTDSEDNVVSCNDDVVESP